jgi:hypothetical protein
VCCVSFSFNKFHLFRDVGGSVCVMDSSSAWDNYRVHIVKQPDNLAVFFFKYSFLRVVCERLTSGRLRTMILSNSDISSV